MKVKTIISSILIAGLLTVSAYSDLSQDEVAAIQAQRDAAAGRTSTAQSKVDSLIEEHESAVAYKIALEERNEAAKEEIRLIKEEIALYNRLISEKGKEVEQAQREEDEQLEKYRCRIRAMEENGDYGILSIILQSDSVSQMLSAIDDYGDVMNSDKVLFERLQEARENLQKLKAEYESYKAECVAKQQLLEEEQRALEEEIAYSEQYIEDLKIAIEQAEDEKEAMEIMLSRAYDNAGAYISSYISTGTTSSVVGSGSFSWPFSNSNRISSTMKARWGGSHNGIDIDGYALEGSSITAADSGTVITSGYDANGYGNYVVIDHGNGYQTLYAHMDSVSVSEGDVVSNGEGIGVVGSTGSATGTHLHFEIFSDGDRIDPLDEYMDGSYELEAGADTPS